MCIPHASGDEPVTAFVAYTEDDVYPTRVGMNRFHTASKISHGTVYPTRVGMNRDVTPESAAVPSVYPTRVGMNRIPNMFPPQPQLYTPREWG